VKKLWVAVFAAVVILGALSILGCGGSTTQPSGGGTDTTQPAQNEVILKDLSFQPKEITIAVGDTVTWKNEDSAQHTVVGDKAGPGDDFESGTLQTGGEFSHTFGQAGTYPYHCSIHPNMKGTVIVK